MTRTFIGRQRELTILEQYHNTASAAFIVVRGRRRIGKSRLIEEFSKKTKRHFIKISGLAPSKASNTKVNPDLAKT